MLTKIRHTWSRHGMGSGAQLVVVACSGGADSMCLLDTLFKLREEFHVKLAVAHFNHGIRGDAAKRDAEFAREQALVRGLPFILGVGDVPALAESEGLSIEEAARRSRYDFFESLPSHFPDIDPDSIKIALGHTADDQAETVLMRLLRGSGIRGLGGIPPVRERYIRPLIEVTRAEVLEHLKSSGVAWVEDETNESPEHLRNRIRRELMPELIRVYNPNLVETLTRTAGICREVADLLVNAAAEFLSKCRIEDDGIIIPRRILRDTHPALAAALVEEAIEHLRGSLWALRAEHRSAIIEAAKSQTTSHITLPGGIEAEVTHDWVRIGPPTADIGDFNIPLEIPGQTRIEAIGATIEAEIVEKKPDALLELSGKDVAYLDLDKLKLPLIARNFRDGDRFQPLGMSATKKLQDFFVDLKIPRAMRRRVPIIVSGDEVIWVAPYRIAQPFRVTGSTRRVLKLSF